MNIDIKDLKPPVEGDVLIGPREAARLIGLTQQAVTAKHQRMMKGANRYDPIFPKAVYTQPDGSHPLWWRSDILKYVELRKNAKKTFQANIPSEYITKFYEYLKVKNMTVQEFVEEKVKQFCEEVEKEMQEQEIEEAMQRAQGNLDIEGITVSEEANDLIRKRLRGEISDEEFLKRAYEIAMHG